MFSKVWENFRKDKNDVFTLMLERMRENQENQNNTSVSMEEKQKYALLLKAYMMLQITSKEFYDKRYFHM